MADKNILAEIQFHSFFWSFSFLCFIFDYFLMILFFCINEGVYNSIFGPHVLCGKMAVFMVQLKLKQPHFSSF